MARRGLQGTPADRQPDLRRLLAGRLADLRRARLSAVRDNPAMLQQRTLKSMTRAVGVGVHSGQRVELTLRPAPPDTGIVFRRVDLPQPVDIPVNAAGGRATRAWPRPSRPAATRARPRCRRSSTCCRPAPAWAWTTWSSTSPPTRCRSSTARPRPSCSCCKAPASSCRTRPSASCACCKPVEVREGEGAALKWARLEPYHGYKLTFEIDFDHPAVNATGQRVELRHGLGPLQARHRARPHLRLHQGRRDDALARPGAGRQHGQRDRDRRLPRCSTPTACATTTSSSSTRSSTRSATCTSPAIRCWPPYSAFKSGPRAEQQAAARAAGRRRRLRDRHLRRCQAGAGRLRRTGAGLVN